MRRMRASVLGPYPKAVSERRCSCRAPRPTASAVAATDRPAANAATTARICGSSGCAAAARRSARASSSAAGSGAASIRSVSRRTSAPDRISANSTRWSRSSYAGTPSSAGAAPGRKRTPTQGPRSPGPGLKARVSGPATSSRPAVHSRSMQPSGSTSPASPPPVRPTARLVHTTAPGSRDARSRYSEDMTRRLRARGGGRLPDCRAAGRPDCRTAGRRPGTPTARPARRLSRPSPPPAPPHPRPRRPRRPSRRRPASAPG